MTSVCFIFYSFLFSHIFLSFSCSLSCALNSLPKHTHLLRLCLPSKWNSYFHIRSLGWTFLTYFASDETEFVCSDSVINIYIDRHDFSISLTAEHMRVVVIKESEDTKLNTLVSTRIHHFQNENHNIIHYLWIIFFKNKAIPGCPQSEALSDLASFGGKFVPKLVK